LIDRASGTVWDVRNWRETNSDGKPCEFVLELEYDPGAEFEQGLTGNIKETIDKLDDPDGDGVRYEEVVTTVANRYEEDPSDVEDAIERLRMHGEIYEPREGELCAV